MASADYKSTDSAAYESVLVSKNPRVPQSVGSRLSSKSRSRSKTRRHERSASNESRKSNKSVPQSPKELKVQQELKNLCKITDGLSLKNQRLKTPLDSKPKLNQSYTIGAQKEQPSFCSTTKTTKGAELAYKEIEKKQLIIQTIQKFLTKTQGTSASTNQLSAKPFSSHSLMNSRQ